MRISDWSSDVCSSDLLRSGLEHERAAGRDRRSHLVRNQVEREVEGRYERTRPDGHALGHAAIAAGAPGYFHVDHFAAQARGFAGGAEESVDQPRDYAARAADRFAGFESQRQSPPLAAPGSYRKV